MSHMTVDVAAALREVDPAELGARIRDLRVARKLTQAQVAGTDMSVAYVSRIEAGNRRPELAMLEAVARRLRTTPHALVTGADPARAQEARLSVRYAELALEQGEAVEAERTAAALLADPDATALADVAVDAAFVHARALEAQGRLEQAAAELERFRGDWATTPRAPAAMIALCRCYREAGDLDRAIDIGETALAHMRTDGVDGLDEGVQLQLTIAAAYHERGDETYALALCQQAVDRAELAGSPTVRASAYWNASMMESARGRNDAAIALAERALALLGEGRDERNLARLRAQLGLMMLRSADADPKQAERHLKKARRELTATSGSVVDLARVDVNLAAARLALGDPAGAEALASDALNRVAGSAPLLEAEAHMVLGRVAEHTGERAQTRREFRAAASALTAAGADRSAAQTWCELGGMFDALGDDRSARDAYRSAAAAAGLRTPTAATTAALVDR